MAKTEEIITITRSKNLDGTLSKETKKIIQTETRMAQNDTEEEVKTYIGSNENENGEMSCKSICSLKQTYVSRMPSVTETASSISKDESTDTCCDCGNASEAETISLTNSCDCEKFAEFP